MKRNWRGKQLIMAVLLTILLCAILSACGTAKGTAQVSQEEMIDDIFSSDAFQAFRNVNPMEIETLEIEKRQTSVEDKVDTVWVKVAAQNDGAVGTMHYIMSYGLYNDGWHLDGVEENRDEEWLFTPTKGPSEELIAQWLPDNVEIIDDTLWLEDGQENITYTYTRSHSYCEITRKESLTFTFDSANTGLWSAFNMTLSENTVWDVCGRYDAYEDGVKTGEAVTIYEFDTDRIVWQLDSQPDELREYDLVDVASCSATDYYRYYAGSGTEKEYIDHGYTIAIENADWSDVWYASSNWDLIFIGKDHIYAFTDRGVVSDIEKKIPRTLRYELIPMQ